MRGEGAGIPLPDHPIRSVRRVMLLVCAPRVGSTWSFEILRQHPLIHVLPTADITRRLALIGRRYPLHLTDKVDAGLRIEISDGVEGIIPAYNTNWISEGHGDHTGVNPFYIEKLHPSFFRFDADAFSHRIRALREELEGRDSVVLVYQLREPIESIRSFISYHQRDQDWGREGSIAGVHEYYRRTYEALVSLFRHHPGPVISYEALSADPATPVQRLLRSLNLKPDDRDGITSCVNAAAAYRRRTSSPFFSSGPDKPRATEVELGLGSEDPNLAQAALMECRDAYRLLLASGKSEWRS